MLKTNDLNPSQRLNQSEEALNQLQAQIASGKLRPNQRLIETALAKELGMSRTPVREALKELQIKGYVIQLDSGGMIVADQTSRQINNLCEVREALETMGITLACKRRTEEQLHRAARIQAAYRKAVLENNNIDESITLNAEFHDELLSGCDNDQLLSLLSTVRDRSHDRRVLRRFSRRQWLTIIRQHDRMLAAVRAQDAVAARRLVREHLRTFNQVAANII